MQPHSRATTPVDVAAAAVHHTQTCPRPLPGIGPAERERMGGGSGALAPPPASTPPPAPQPAHCRICWEHESAESDDALLQWTCSCSGSLAHVHARCLLNWQRHAADPSRCSTCRAPVRLPPGVADAARLPPLWREHLHQHLAEARQQGAALTAFRCGQGVQPGFNVVSFSFSNSTEQEHCPSCLPLAFLPCQPCCLPGD